MPLIDVRCREDACQATWEHMRPLADYPAVPPCPTCGSSNTEQYHPPPRTRWSIDPIVIYRAPDGTFRYPGEANGQSAAAYDRQGFTRVEMRTAADVRRVEAEVERHEMATAARRSEYRQFMREQRESANRSELRHRMRSMSRFGRDVARRAMEQGDARPRRATAPRGFFVEVMSQNRSNRDESRDGQGRRRRD